MVADLLDANSEESELAIQIRRGKGRDDREADAQEESARQTTVIPSFSRCTVAAPPRPPQRAPPPPQRHGRDRPASASFFARRCRPPAVGHDARRLPRPRPGFSHERPEFRHPPFRQDQLAALAAGVTEPTHAVLVDLSVSRVTREHPGHPMVPPPGRVPSATSREPDTLPSPVRSARDLPSLEATGRRAGSSANTENGRRPCARFGSDPIHRTRDPVSGCSRIAAFCESCRRQSFLGRSP